MTLAVSQARERRSLVEPAGTGVPGRAWQRTFQCTNRGVRYDPTVLGRVSGFMVPVLAQVKGAVRDGV